MKLPFSKKKRVLTRGADGKFTATDEEGNVTSGAARNFRTMSKTLEEAQAFTSTIEQMGLDSLKRRVEFQELTAQMAGEPNPDADPFEQALAQALPLILQRITQQGSGGPSGDVGSFQPPPPSPGAPTPQIEGITPLDKVNNILKGISKVPDKLINKDMVKEIAKQQGIEYEYLEGTVKKLSKVMV